MKFKNILWDFDGTLSDPQLGILNCYKFTLSFYSLPIPSDAELRRLIGPPLQDGMRKLVPQATDEEIKEMVTKFREQFGKTGIWENEVFPKIPGLLQSLQKYRHYIATSKPEVYAKQTTVHLGITRYFIEVYGSELNGMRSRKGDVIAYLLERERLNPAETVMIGDTHYDVIGAKENGLFSIGITWGFGTREELVAAGADMIVSDPDELRAYFTEVKVG